MERMNEKTALRECSYFEGPISNVKPFGTVAFDRLFDWIRNGKYKQQIEAIRAERDPKKQSAMKQRLDYFTPSVLCTERNNQNITDHTGVLCMDVDGKDNPNLTPEKMRVTVMNDPLLHPWGIFRSALGKGIKMFLRYDATKYSVEDCAHAVMQYMADACHITADRACCDATRACFVSDDPELYLSTSNLECAVDVAVWLPRFEKLRGKPEKIPGSVHKYIPSAVPDVEEDAPISVDDVLLLEHVNAVVDRIDRDIAPEYEDFMRLGMSLATLGEPGREAFVKCCSHYKGEQTRDLNKFYDDCMRERRGDISIATFFELCCAAGVDINDPNGMRMNEISTVNEMESLPIFPEWIFEKLPPLLKKIMQHADTQPESCMLLMTSIATISSLLPNYYMKYGKHRMEANISFFGLAKAGSGKGLMSFCARLVKPIHEKMLHESEMIRRDHRARMEEQKKNKKVKTEYESEEIPPLKIFKIPADVSASAFIRTFAETKRGIMFETEGDTLSKTLGMDFGEYSDLLRKAAHHEPVTFMRKDKNEGVYLSIDYPCLSVVLSGTPKQLKNLMKDSENGLFSRFSIFYMTSEPEWMDQYAMDEGESFEDDFDEYANDLYVIYTKLDCLGKEGVLFRMTKEQRNKILSFFRTKMLQYHLLYDGQYDGVMRRLGLLHGRICMVLTALRCESVDCFDKPLVCADEDVDIALEIVSVLNQHVSFAFRSLSPDKSTNVMMKNMSPQYQFYYSLPQEFSSSAAVNIGEKLNIKKSTIYKYVHQFLEGKKGDGCLIELCGNKRYRKTLNVVNR